MTMVVPYQLRQKRLQHFSIPLSTAKCLRTTFSTSDYVLRTIKLLNVNHALENLRTLDDFNFTNFPSDGVMKCSPNGTSSMLLPQNDSKQLLSESFTDKFCSPFDENRL